MPDNSPEAKFDRVKPTQEMLRLVAGIDEFKGAWRGLRAISPGRLLMLRHVATIESVGSSTRIEGVRLTNSQVETLLSNLDIGSFRSRDEEEVAGYAALMETIFESWEHLPLTENYVGQLHGILLRYSSKDKRHRGYYKTLANHVEVFAPDGTSLGIVFETATPFETPFQMADLIGWTRESLDGTNLHPLLMTGVFIVRFLAIHPFQDGNGRLTRALTTLLLLRSGYAYVPYSSLESVIEENREAYYRALRRSQTSFGDIEPDWESWLLFFLRALDTQKTRLQREIEREELIDGALPGLSVLILEMARERGAIRSPDIAAVADEARGTIRNRLNELVARGLLIRHSKGRATWYTPG